MNSHAYLVSLFICSLIVFYNEVEGGRWNISTEEDLKFEKQLKMMNKPAIKSIHTDYGDIYDCIDFYKQPAFDHPLLKNYKVDFDQIKASISRKSLHRVSHNESEYKYFKLKDGGCPDATVPIRRTTKEDLIRVSAEGEIPIPGDDKIAHPGDDLVGAQYAGTSTIPTLELKPRFVQIGGAPTIYQPEVTDQQYSAARIKIANEGDTIEVGWRVDPALFRDNKSRFYIRIDAGQNHCFNTRCPGFVVVDNVIALGAPLEFSTRGGDIVSIPLFLTRDMTNGNWFVEVGEQHRKIGYWPSQLFTGLTDLASYGEWGGEVYSPPGTPKPAMGAGYQPTKPNTDYDAHFKQLTYQFRDSDPTSAFYTKSFETSINYRVVDEGDTRDDFFGHLIFFGGSVSPN